MSHAYHCINEPQLSFEAAGAACILRGLAIHQREAEAHGTWPDPNPNLNLHLNLNPNAKPTPTWRLTELGVRGVTYMDKHGMRSFVIDSVIGPLAAHNSTQAMHSILKSANGFWEGCAKTVNQTEMQEFEHWRDKRTNPTLSSRAEQALATAFGRLATHTLDPPGIECAPSALASLMGDCRDLLVLRALP